MEGLRLSRKQIAGLAVGLVALVICTWYLRPVIFGGGGGAPAETAEKKQQEKEEEKKPDKPKPKPDFAKLKLTALPHDGQDLTQGVKPGHWATATLDAKANNFDFAGELEVGITTNNRPVDLEHTAYRLFSTRPASLPKGQSKRLELLFFVPRSLSTNVVTRLYGRGGGAEVLREGQPFSHLPSYQYFFYVLSSQPDRYRYLKVLDSIKPPWDDLSGDRERDEYYRVQLPRVGQTVSLPSHPLAWSSIAVLLWDDIHPKVLRTDQQQAVLDWLHWGGQILVSGPRTLDLLRGSFLEPYLPAEGGESITLDEKTLAELNRNWTVSTVGKNVELPLTVTRPWPAVKLTKREAGSAIPGTGGLLYERRVGRGRVVVSAFRLLERDLISWRGYDSLLNNALLRRPPRIYSEGNLAAAAVDWVQWLGPGRVGSEGRPYKVLKEARFEPTFVTNVRYFSRDGGSEEEREKLEEFAGLPADVKENIDQLYANTGAMLEATSFEDSRRIAATAHNPGLAGWSDFSPVAHAARESLREAAGIVVPHRSFVVWVVGLYLLVIVPLNWLVFWALGKVEWAWIAAPLIAIVCAMSVVKMARLDIGFARSKTEVAVVELHGDHPRAHVTRYTALYTSLSTPYDVHFEDPSALAAPFSTDPLFKLLTRQEASPVMYRRDNEVHLTGYQVSSNSTGMLHTEHMLDLGGAISLNMPEGLVPRVSNGTTLPLEGTAVLRRENGTLEYAWLGTLRPRQELVLNFKPFLSSGAELVERQAEKISAEEAVVGSINLRSLIRLAEDASSIGEGDVRLVAWTESEIPGVEIEPRASQQRHASLVVANLRTGLGPNPVHDVNTRAEVAKAADEELENWEVTPEAPTP